MINKVGWAASALMCLVFLLLGMVVESKIMVRRYIDITNEVQVYKVDRLTITSEYESLYPYKLEPCPMPIWPLFTNFPTYTSGMFYVNTDVVSNDCISNVINNIGKEEEPEPEMEEY